MAIIADTIIIYQTGRWRKTNRSMEYNNQGWGLYNTYTNDTSEVPERLVDVREQRFQISNILTNHLHFTDLNPAFFFFDLLGIFFCPVTSTPFTISTSVAVELSIRKRISVL